MTAQSEARRVGIPPLVRWNTVRLAAAQAFSGAGMGMVYSIGPLMVVGVSGNTALAGLSVSLMGLSRFLVAYPVGKITDAYGRKPAMLLGQMCGLVGAILVGTATIAANLPLLIGSLLLFGMGMNAAQQLRVAAADMYPPTRRAEGLGYVLTGSLVGVGVGPLLVTLAQSVAPGLHVEPLGIPWLLMPLLIVPAVVLITQVRPDPKTIAEHLADYYPGLPPGSGQPVKSDQPVSLSSFLGHPVRRVAVFAYVAAQVNMAVVMVSSSLLLHHLGSTLSAIAWSSALHSAGMFGFSVPIGRLTDRVGRRRVLLTSVAIATLGAMTATLTSDFWLITLGAFLVGLGWSAANIATTAVIADTTQAGERGRSVGLADTMTAMANILTPLLAGPFGVLFGVPSTGLLAAAATVPPLALLFTLRERAPGVYHLPADASTRTA
jgi:MFS family permease